MVQYRYDMGRSTVNNLLEVTKILIEASIKYFMFLHFFTSSSTKKPFI